LPPHGVDLLSDEQRLQLLINAVSDQAIYMLDPEGRVSSWNAGAARMQGYAAAEALGLDHATFFTAEDRAAGKPEQALETARQVGHHETEGWCVRKDGTRFWVLAVLEALRDADGNLVGFAKIIRDMTDRMNAMQALRDSERRFRLLVEGVVDYAIFMIDRQGLVSNWNSGAQRIKGYSATEIIGQHFSVFYTEEDRAAGMPQRALESAARRGKHEAEGWRVRKDGTRFFASVIIDAVRDETGELIGFAKVTRDISERRAAHEALERTRAALAQSQKIEAIGQLTGGIAHDFNNLLTVITSNLDLILQNPGNSMRTERLAQAAQRAAGRGARLIQQLLAFARRQPLQPELIDINALIRGSEALLRRACGDRVALELRLGEALNPVHIDGAQFEAALLNLVFNARDAMSQGGRLQISTENRDFRAGDAAGTVGMPAGAYIVVSVEDQGLGMTPEVLAHAFEPFFTTKDTGKGSGLGLSQVHGFAAQSGGHVTLDSVPGKGTTVRLFLPAAATPAAVMPRRPTVLLVEDDPDVLQSTVEMVRGLGYEVLTASDAVDALAMLRRDLVIDVLFSDIVMPRGMNGIELAKEARRLRPDLRILLSSGYATGILTADHGLTAEFSFIGKPYRWPELAEKLRGGALH
jgi:PAS domain S-box-containing protein